MRMGSREANIRFFHGRIVNTKQDVSEGERWGMVGSKEVMDFLNDMEALCNYAIKHAKELESID